MVKRSLSCWQCGLPIEDASAHYCPHCGSPLVSSLSWWERFRHRPAWVQALALLAIVAVIGAAGIVAAPRLLDLVRGEPAPTVAPPTATQPVAAALPTTSATVAATGEPSPQVSPTSTEGPTATATATSTPETPEPTPTEDLEAALLDAAYRFQDAKATSQRTGDTSALSQDLTGDALERQIELVERWRDQGCYWEISLNAPLTIRILEVRGPDAALIEVGKVETRLLYCGDTLESETRNDAYTTTYLMQRIDGRWYTAERE